MCDTCQKHQEEAKVREQAAKDYNSKEYAAQYGTHNPPAGSTLLSESKHTQASHNYGDAVPSVTGNPALNTTPTVIPSNFDPKEAFKDDSKKTDLSLLPFRPLSEIAEVLEFGAAKYSRDNWRKGFAHERLVAALLRHVLAYNDGETNDPETGLCHLAHAGCMLMFLMETRHTHPELDYRRVHETG